MNKMTIEVAKQKLAEMYDVRDGSSFIGRDNDVQKRINVYIEKYTSAINHAIQHNNIFVDVPYEQWQAEER